MTLATRLATAAAVLPLTLAGPASAGQLDRGHAELADAVDAAGVTLLINPPEICDQEDAPMGLYSGTHKLMVVCKGAKHNLLADLWRMDEMREQWVRFVQRWKISVSRRHIGRVHALP